MLYNLTGQSEALANATRVVLEEMNAQLHVTSKAAQINRLVLDLVLLYESGTRGYLSLTNDTCVHILNVTQDLSKHLHHMKCVTKASRGLRESMEVGWMKKLLHGLEFSLVTGWIMWEF